MIHLLAAIALAPGGFVDVSLNGVSVEWHGSVRRAKAYIRNNGLQPVGTLKVAFVGKQNSGAPPVVTKAVQDLAVNETVEVQADFASLATAANGFLSKVNGLTVTIDPENDLPDSTPNNDKLETQLPSVQGAESIFGSAVRPTGYRVCSAASPLSQVWYSFRDYKLLGIELSIARTHRPTDGGLILQIFEDGVLLRTAALPNAKFVFNPFSRPPVITGFSPGAAYFDFRTHPITIGASHEIRIDLTNTSSEEELRVGIVPNTFFGYLAVDGSFDFDAGLALKQFVR